jgi:hypothetical protein
MNTLVIQVDAETRIVNVRSDDELTGEDYTLVSAYLLLLAARTYQGGLDEGMDDIKSVALSFTDLPSDEDIFNEDEDVL